MIKTITKVTACSIIFSIAISTFTADVKASSLLPAAGIAASTGVGLSLNDITVKKLKASTREKSAKLHTKITKTSEIALAGKGTNSALPSITNTAISANTDDSVVVETQDVRLQQPVVEDIPVDTSVQGSDLAGNILLVDTPASIALKALEENKGEAKSAIIEVTNNEEANEDGALKIDTNSSIVITEAVTSNASEDNSTVTVSADAATPDIDIKPEAGDVKEGEQDLTGTVIAQVDGYVNVRDTPSEDGEIVGKLYNNSAGEWLGKEGDWYKISSGSVVGYVKGEYVVTGQAAVKLAAEVGIRTATVHTTTLKVREGASLDSPVLGLIPDGDKLTVLEETDEWVKVSIEEGDGWINKEYVSIVTEFPPAESKAEEEARLKREKEEREKANAAARRASQKSQPAISGKATSYVAPGTGPGAKVANFGLQFVGNPYVFGGSSLTSGTDCSGFTMSVYRNFGVSLPHSSGAQRAVGYGVGSLAEAMPGDIICYSGHVGLYIGGGMIVHASTAKTGIKVSNANYRQILAIRRIF